jgi:hypothetical protein
MFLRHQAHPWILFPADEPFLFLPGAGVGVNALVGVSVDVN